MFVCVCVCVCGEWMRGGNNWKIREKAGKKNKILSFFSMCHTLSSAIKSG